MTAQNQKTQGPPSSELVAQIQQALQHQKNREMDAAGEIFKKITAENPDNPDVLQIAAIFYGQLENYTEVGKLLEKAVLLKPVDFNINKLLGRALFKNGRHDEAQIHIEKALVADFDDPEVNLMLGTCLLRKAQYGSAENPLKKSLEKKNSIEAQNRLAECLIFLRREKEAVKFLTAAVEKQNFDYETLVILARAYKLSSSEAQTVLIKAILAYPEEEEAKSLLGLTFEQGIGPSEISPEIAKVLSLCLRSKYVGHDILIDMWHRQFFWAPQNQKAQEIGAAPTYDTFKALFEKKEYRDNLLQPFFIDAVKAIAPYIFLENLLTRLRQYYLERIIGGAELTEQDLSFLSALSLHCFYNEFVFSEADEEKKHIEAIAAKLNGRKYNPHELLIYSCYQLLIKLDTHEDILRKKDDLPAYLHKTIDAHIAQILAEREAKKTISALGKITDGISLKVQSQYEEHPYPRWQSYSFAMPLLCKTSDPALIKPTKVLVAGCGTGRHILNVYTSVPGADITAVDLSSASLAYAALKLREYGVPDVKLLQADILELGQLGEQFDKIESVGVLHHMKDPQQGLNVLAGLLKQDGEMALGLYSEYARRDVEAVRALAAEKGWKDDADGIRACRTYVKSNGKDFNFLARTTDFYTMSGCRDLMFHVQEMRYTIPSLRALLNNAGLKFVKFTLAGHLMESYRKAFPDDPAGSNLYNWDKFEQQNPEFFAGMYQFRCRKRRQGDLE